jgi:hypothetical protein
VKQLTNSTTSRNVNDEMTDEEFFGMAQLDRPLTDDEFQAYVSEWRKRLPGMRRRTKEAIEDMRRISRGLRPIRAERGSGRANR